MQKHLPNIWKITNIYKHVETNIVIAYNCNVCIF